MKYINYTWMYLYTHSYICIFYIYICTIFAYIDKLSVYNTMIKLSIYSYWINIYSMNIFKYINNKLIIYMLIHGRYFQWLHHGPHGPSGRLRRLCSSCASCGCCWSLQPGPTIPRRSYNKTVNNGWLDDKGWHI